MRANRLRWLAAIGSLAILGLVWLIGPVTPAIYDGLPIGTPPYRYLEPPKGSPRTPPPSSASAIVVLADNPVGVSLSTREEPPQADVSIPTQFLMVPVGVGTVRASVAPVLPPAVAPTDGKIDGNVYRVAVTTLAGQPLILRSGAEQEFQVQLRGTGSSREPHVEQYVNRSWTRLDFTHPKSGIFLFNPSQLGNFALVLPPDHSIFGPGLTAAVAVGGALVVLALILTMIRRRRSRAWADAPGQDQDRDVFPDSELGVE